MFYFIRHGQSESNKKNIFATARTPLTKEGIAQVKRSALAINKLDLKFDLIFSSDLWRAKQTAKIFVDKNNDKKSKIIYDHRIREYDVGSMAGKLEVNVDSYTLINSQGAENPEDFKYRINNFLQEIAKIDKSILIVSHAGVYRMIRVMQKGLSPEVFYDLEAPENAKLIKLNLNHWVE